MTCASLLLAALLAAGEPPERHVVQADLHLVEAHYRRGLTATIGRPEGPLWVSVGAAVSAERLELHLRGPDIVAWWRADLTRLRHVLEKARPPEVADRSEESEP